MAEEQRASLEKFVAEILKEPLKQLRHYMESEEGKSLCLETFAKTCRPPVNYAVFYALKILVVTCDTFGPNLVGEATQTGLLRLIDRVPVVERILRAFMKVLGRIQDATKYKQAMLDEIRETHQEVHGIKVSQATPLEILEAISVKIQFDKVRDKLEDEFDGLLRLVETEFENLKEPKLEWPRLDAQRGGIIESLHYTASQDEFVGREDELECLRGFLADDGFLPNKFRWMLVTGRGGDGKSRLAFELVRQAQPNWRAGRLDEVQFRNLNPAVWTPRRPTLIVIDYAPRWPEQVHALLHGITAHCHLFEHPLRVLLIAREATDDWLKRVVTPSGDGLLIKERVHHKSWCPEGQLRLKPLAKDLLVKLMRARFDRRKRQPPPDEILLAAAERLDMRFEEVEGTYVPEPPRPLFAAAAAEALLAASNEEHAPSIAAWQDILAGIAPEKTFSWLIDRDRTHFWKIQGDESGGADKQLALHEQLLVVTTMALGHVSWEQIEALIGADPVAARHLPGVGYGSDCLDPQLFRRMTGSEGQSLAALEPDILGEFFVLEKLIAFAKQKRTTIRKMLIDVGWRIAPRDVAAFIRRAYMDFPTLVAEAEFLLPTLGVADEWAAKLLRALVVDLGNASEPLHRSRKELAKLTPVQQERDLRELIKWADAAVRLMPFLRAFAGGPAAYHKAAAHEAALAWEQVAYLVAVIVEPDLLSDDPRFSPIFRSSDEIEKPRAPIALVAAFRAAVSAAATAEAPQPFILQGQTGGAGSRPEQVSRVAIPGSYWDELAGALVGRIISVTVIGDYLDWIEAICNQIGDEEARRAFLAACRSAYFICHSLGGASLCERLGDEALRRVAAYDDAHPILLEADLFVLVACSFTLVTAILRTEPNADSVVQRSVRERLDKIVKGALKIRSGQLTTQGTQRALVRILTNASSTPEPDMAMVKACADTLATHLAAHPAALDLGYGLAVLARLFVVRTASARGRDPEAPVDQIVTPEQWLDIDRWVPGLVPMAQTPVTAIDTHDVERLSLLISALTSMCAVESLLIADEPKASGKLRQSLSHGLLAGPQDRLDGQASALAVDSLALAFWPNAVASEVRTQWFRWLLEGERRRGSCAGFAVWLTAGVPEIFPGDEALLTEIADSFDAVLDGPDQSCAWLENEPNLHHVAADAVLALCAHAYAYSDWTRFERWAELLERPARRGNDAFSLHRLRIATLRVARAGVLDESEIERAIERTGRRSPDGPDFLFAADFLLSASCVAESHGNGSLADRIVTHLASMENAS
jgi:hypothetical protein